MPKTTTTSYIIQNRSKGSNSAFQLYQSYPTVEQARAQYKAIIANESNRSAYDWRLMEQVSTLNEVPTPKEETSYTLQSLTDGCWANSKTGFATLEAAQAAIPKIEKGSSMRYRVVEDIVRVCVSAS